VKGKKFFEKSPSDLLAMSIATEALDFTTHGFCLAVSLLKRGTTAKKKTVRSEFQANSCPVRSLLRDPVKTQHRFAAS
jgi:hypothetical protein